MPGDQGSDQDSVLESLGPARRYADPSASERARLMAAGGALPLPPHQVAGVLFALSLDPHAEVAEKAGASLAALPEKLIDSTLEADVHSALLAMLAERFLDDAVRLEKIALNPATGDGTICFLARLPFPQLIDIISENQTRLLRCPEILEALGQNALASQATIDRIVQFLGLGHSPAGEAPAEALAETRGVETRLGIDTAEGLPKDLVEEPESPGTEPDQGGARHTSLLQSIREMSVIEKIRLARFGTTDARRMLVHDRNRLVALAAVHSPKLTEKEVLRWAKARHLSDEVIRTIAGNREWTRHYAVRYALVTNPRTPVTEAMRFVQTLVERDLKTLMRSREVPAPVSQTARKLLMRKGQR